MKYHIVFFTILVLFHDHAKGFDYWKISQIWSRGYCHVKGSCIPTKIKLTRFSIHGLWPSNISFPQPQYCTDEDFKDSKVRFVFLSNNILM